MIVDINLMKTILSIVIINFFIPIISSTIPYFNPVNGKINEIINVNVSLTNLSVIFYDYSSPEIVHNETPLRINIKTNIFRNQSILVIIKDGNHVVSNFELWHQFKGHEISVSRTICPNLNSKNRILSVELSSESSQIVTVTAYLFIDTNFIIRLNDPRSVVINKNNPDYFLFKFESGIKSVRIDVESKDDICMIFSVQEAMCPVNDRIISIKSTGVYQTVLKEGTMIIENEKKFNDAIFIVFVLNVNDETCQGGKVIHIITQNSTVREKNFQLTLSKVEQDYTLPIFGALGFYLLFYVTAPFISYIYHHCCLKDFKNEGLPSNDECIRPMEDPSHYGSLEDRPDNLYDYRTSVVNRYIEDEIDVSSFTSHNQTVDTNDDSNESASDFSNALTSFHFKKTIFLSELSMKKSELLDRKYFLYLWYLIIISVFYALPVVQLVINFQQTFDVTGNQDICFYNFRCTRPLFIFTAFNNIISNIGYVLLGILFTLVTYRRHHLYNECKLAFNNPSRNHGIPQYYGLFYAMGVALTMQGILSACYHICPSRSNFQFDTAYMYILACLCLIKLYQTRHPDINATAHSFFMTMALLIFVGVIGVVYNKLAFWCLFTISYFLLSMFLTFEVYYFGKWKIEIFWPRRIYLSILKDKWECLVPVYGIRMVILILINIANTTLALYGAIVQPSNFSSHFLAIFMTNLLLYFLIYILMKAIHCEICHPLSVIYILVAIVCWIFSIYCFIRFPTNWQETPAVSRQHNANCIFLNFYDVHDIWHFLSSMSLFFSFMALQNIDDSLFNIERNKIPVF